VENKHVNLEKLFDLLRAVGENYESQSGEEELLLVKPHEVKKFSEELMAATEDFIKGEVDDGAAEGSEETEENFIEYDTFLYDDEDDDDDDEM
jgi:hypothetical protein